MCCANWLLSVAAVAIFVFAVWPNIVGAEVAKWIIAIAAVIVLICAWTGCKCKYCEKTEKTTAKRKR